MSTDSVADAPSGHRRRFRRAGRWVTVIAAVAIVLVVVVAAYTVVQYVQSRPSETQLVVYTYPTLFDGNCGASPNLSAVLAPFEAAHDVAIDFECPAGTLVSTLLAQRSAPQADLVIGLDEVTAPEAEAEGLLVPYVSPQLDHVDPNVTRELSSDGGATPYEWGYLGIDYNLSFAQATGTSVADLSFPSFASNLSLAHGLVVEDPTTDIVGEEFLLWEIEFYETVVHENWQSWWQSVDPALQFAPDWGSAFSEFDGGPGSPPMVVSYTTDPGYAVEYGQAHQYNSTATLWNGSEYGWRSVYGIGIVQGTRHLTLDQELVDWFLSGTVQSQIPLNEWEYPANRTIALPSVFGANPDPTDIVPLDDATSPAQIALDLPGYLETWQTIDNSAG